jgi:hypothetical protein
MNKKNEQKQANGWRKLDLNSYNQVKWKETKTMQMKKKKLIWKKSFQKEETSRKDRLNIWNNCEQKVLLTSHLKKEKSQNQLKIKKHEYTLVTCL